MGKRKIIGIGVLVVLVASYVGVKIYLSRVAERNVNEAIAKVAHFVDIDYQKVRVDVFGLDVRVSDILVSPVDSTEKIKIDEIVIHDADDKNDIPAFASLSCNGIELNVDDLGDEGKIFRELGYDGNLSVNLDIDYLYDKDKKEIDVKKIAIEVEKGGKVDVSFLLGNISLDQQGMIGLLFNFPQVVFHKAEIAYNDASLVERLMQRAAKERNITLEDFKTSLIEDVEAEIEEAQDESIKSALREVKTFLKNPGKITISASPSTPYPFARIIHTEELRDIVRLLNIHIRS